MEAFGILELVLPLGDGAPEKPEARLIVENQSLIGHVADGSIHFRFCPKDAKTYSFEIRGNVPILEGRDRRDHRRGSGATSIREISKLVDG